MRNRMVCLLAALCCVMGLCVGVSALEVDCDGTYCFAPEDFSNEEELKGVCIMSLPDAGTGTVMLGQRVIRAGDILTAEQVAQMTFAPLMTQTDGEALVTYLPIFENRVAPAAQVTISIRGKEDKAPVAEDSSMETYKNLSNEGRLKVTDPEGGSLNYTVVRQPRRGTLEVRADGSFVYTPKKNKVGVDSFTFTAVDPAGNVSRQATVTIQILKPADAARYSDTEGSSCRFAAEWMKNTGLFVGEKIGGQLCFNEKRAVSRGEFLTMMVKALNIPVDESLTGSGYAGDAPQWMKPYLAAALRAGLTAGLPAEDSFGHSAPITGGEAAVMLQNALDLSVSAGAMESADAADEDVKWAMPAVTVMQENGVELAAGEPLDRGQAAEALYRASKLAQDAPGLAMYR